LGGHDQAPWQEGVFGGTLPHDPTGFGRSSPIVFGTEAGLAALVAQIPKESDETVDSIKESIWKFFQWPPRKDCRGHQPPSIKIVAIYDS
jgi:hypothetical protein